MNTFAQIMGWLCIAALGVTLAALAVIIAAEMCRKALERFEWAVADKTRAELARQVRVCAHWLSESPDARHALDALAEQIRDYSGCGDPGTVRERWRQLRKAASEAQR